MMSPLTSIIILILFVTGPFLITMIAIFLVYWPAPDPIPCGQPLLVSISENIYEDARLIKFICPGVIVSRDRMVALAECFVDEKLSKKPPESLLVSSGSEYWYSSMNMHRIVNISKDKNILCISVRPSFPSCAYPGGKISISNPEDFDNIYRAKGWNASSNWAAPIVTKNLYAKKECSGMPGALIVDQSGWLLGLQGAKCEKFGVSMKSEVHYFKDLIGMNGTCGATFNIMVEKINQTIGKVG